MFYNMPLVRKIFIFTLLGSAMFISSCSSLKTPHPIGESSEVNLVADPGLSNSAYAARLSRDGWPVEKLNTAVSVKYLSDAEKNLVLAHNLIRHDPRKYAELYVSEYINYYQGNHFHYPGLEYIILTHEGVSAARELYRELRRADPAPLFFPSEKMTRAARSHAQYQARTGQTGHDGQGGMRARIEREGNWDRSIAENIAYGNFSAHDAVLGLMIDDGVPGRGHRINILNENLQVLGVAIANHPEFDGGVFVVKYAGGFEDVSIP